MFHQYLCSHLTCLSMLICNPFICLLPKGVIKMIHALLSPFVVQWLKYLCLFVLFVRWMPSCHLGALPCEMGGFMIACLMSQTNMRLDRCSERKYQEALCWVLYWLFSLLSHVEFMGTFQYSRMVFILFMNYFKIELEHCRFGLAHQTISLKEWQKVIAWG